MLVAGSPVQAQETQANEEAQEAQEAQQGADEGAGEAEPVVKTYKPSANLAMGFGFNSGNLKTVRVSLSGRYFTRNQRLGLVLLPTVFTQWLGIGEDQDLTQLDRDIFMTGGLYVFLKKKFYLFSLARYESSLRRQLDHRVLLGGGPGMLLLDSSSLNGRAWVGGVVEHSRFPGSNFNRDIGNTDGLRTQVRATIFTSGSYRPSKTVGVNWFAFVMPDVQSPSDVRLQMRLELDTRVYKDLFLRLSAFYYYETVVLDTVSSGDLRTLAGIVWKSS